MRSSSRRQTKATHNGHQVPRYIYMYRQKPLTMGIRYPDISTCTDKSHSQWASGTQIYLHVQTKATHNGHQVPRYIYMYTNAFYLRVGLGHLATICAICVFFRLSSMASLSLQQAAFSFVCSLPPYPTPNAWLLWGLVPTLTADFPS